MKILHLMPCNKKFIEPFREFIDNHFKNIENTYFIYNQKGSNSCKDKYSNCFFLNILTHLIYFYKNDKIIIHSLTNSRLILFFLFQPWLLTKCYWVMWGGDLYSYLYKTKTLRSYIHNFIFRSVIKNMGHFVSYIQGDYELAQKWYGAKGKYHECFMYPSNLYKDYSVNQMQQNTINIQLGHSAYETNNHLEILEELAQYRNENIKIFAPLSYGNISYAKTVANKGNEIFGNKFIAINDMMTLEKYLAFLAEIDIAIFAAKHQVAMGNIITLLGLGKKIFMQSDVTAFQMLKNKGIKLFDVKSLNIHIIDEITKKQNKQRVKEYFSQENYLNQLENLFREI